MGGYYHLACRDCRHYIHFGKKFSGETGEVLQGMYSEKTNRWVQDARIWEAVQTFLLEHEGHTLCFGGDGDEGAIDDYIEIELDHLIGVG